MKTLSLILTLCLVMVSLPALATESGTLPIVTEPITLTIAVTRHASDATENFNQKAFAMKAEEETGIHINWIEISSNANEKVAVLLAGEAPDVFMGCLTDAQIVDNASLFLPIGDLIEEYCPNVMATYDQVDGWENFLTYPDGNIYGMAGFIWKDINESVQSLPYINQAWLDKLGLPMPTTLDELYDTLVAFRDNDMDGNGDPTNEIPLNFCNAHWADPILKFAYPWGITGYFNIEDGKIVSTLDTPAFREYLEFYHKLSQEGLFNTEGFSTTVEQFNAQMDSMQCGMFLGWGPNNVITGEENQAQFVAFTPVAAEGYEAVLTQTSPICASRNAFVISKESTHWKEALQWWDYLSQSQEFAYFVHRGPVDLAYEKADDGFYYKRTPSDEELIAAGYQDYIGKAGTSAFSASLGSYLACPLMLKPIITPSVRYTALNEWKDLYLPKQTMPKSIVPGDRAEEFAFMTEGLTEAVQAYIASSIIDGVTDQSWQEFQAQIQSLGYAYYLQYQQGYFDGNL